MGIVLEKGRKTIQDDGFPKGNELRFEVVLAAKIRRVGGAGQKFKDDFGLELGFKGTSLTTWHGNFSWLGPVFIMLLVQRQGRTTEPARLLAARKAFEEAVKQLELAKGLPATNADLDIQNARSELGKINQAIHPINVDFDSIGFKTTWSYSQPQWLVQNQGAKARLLTAPLRRANLKSPQLELPRDFDFQFEFAVLDENGMVHNELLSSYRSLLKLTLVAKKATDDNSVFDIGQDPDTRLERVASIEVDKKRYTLRKLAKTEPITVRLVCHHDRATVTLGSEILASFPLSTEFKQVIFDVNNGLNVERRVVTSVALSEISLKLYVDKQAERGP
jgi:hypothetical protein